MGLYSTFGYGEQMYGEPEISVEPPAPPSREIDLMKYLTSNYQDGENIRKLIAIEEYELGELGAYIEDLERQFCVDTATWGLTMWEQELAIKRSASQSLEERREQIRAKLRSYGTVTVERLQNIAEAFSGGETEIIENPDAFKFVIRFIGVKGIPRNIGALKEIITMIKPAHLTYDWEFTWTWWAYLTDQEVTWNKAGEGSWNDLKTYDDGKE